jgi:multicomponent Na+:H+ antiporter subunit D
VGTGIELALRVDTLGLLFALLASFLWLLTSVYAIGYMRGQRRGAPDPLLRQLRRVPLHGDGPGLLGQPVHLLPLLRALTIATYPLVTHKGTPEAVRGRAGATSPTCSPAAQPCCWRWPWSTRLRRHHDFVPGGFVGDALRRRTQVVVLALFGAGLRLEGGGHAPAPPGCPAAMVAPTPVSALLHAVAVVKAGVFGFARTIGYVVGPGPLDRHRRAAWSVWPPWLRSPSWWPRRSRPVQDNLKRRLAFSTIAHLSYIVLGLTLLTASGWTGGLLHIVNHAALKITLFFCAGDALRARPPRPGQPAGRDRPADAGDHGRLRRRLARPGRPAAHGWVRVQVVPRAGRAPTPARLAFAACHVAQRVLTAGYLFPIVVRAFLRPPSPPAVRWWPARRRR